MAYEDPIRIAKLKLAELDQASGSPARPAVDIRKFGLEELIGALPTVCPNICSMHWIRQAQRTSGSPSAQHGKPVGVHRLRVEAGSQQWRLFSIRYAKERVLVEHWLHMIHRGLAQQPTAAPTIVQTATMIEGYGDVYSQGLED